LKDTSVLGHLLRHLILVCDWMKWDETFKHLHTFRHNDVKMITITINLSIIPVFIFRYRAI